MHKPACRETRDTPGRHPPKPPPYRGAPGPAHLLVRPASQLKVTHEIPRSASPIGSDRALLSPATLCASMAAPALTVRWASHFSRSSPAPFDHILHPSHPASMTSCIPLHDGEPRPAHLSPRTRTLAMLPCTPSQVPWTSAHGASLARHHPRVSSVLQEHPFSPTFSVLPGESMA